MKNLELLGIYYSILLRVARCTIVLIKLITYIIVIDIRTPL